jgi:hypothetical protein
MKIGKLLKAEGLDNVGHGHVFTRPDSTIARCGGPGMCEQCKKDFETLQAAFTRVAADVGGARE